MDSICAFLWGFVGGFMGEAIGWIEATKMNPTPVYLKKVFYWICLIILSSIGGLLAYAYYKDNKIQSVIFYINIGVSAP